MAGKVPPNEYKFQKSNYGIWWKYKNKIYEMDPHNVIPLLPIFGPAGIEEGTTSPVQNPDAGKRLMDVLEMTDEEADAAVIEGKWNRARKHREKLLLDTDWSQGTDVPSSLKAKYATFRQALRDITDQSDPDDITWPDRVAD